MLKKSMLLVMVLLISFSMVFMTNGAFAQNDEILVRETYVKDIRQETNETETEEEENKSIWESIEDGVSSIINAVIGLITAPFEALASVFDSWGDAVSGPLGILIARGVLFALYFLFRLIGFLDMFLDRFN